MTPANASCSLPLTVITMVELHCLRTAFRAIPAVMIAAAATGCWSSTRPTKIGAGQSAVVDALDSVWESTDGGKVLQHCFFDGKQKTGCENAYFSGKSPRFFEDPIILIDPTNLGSIAGTTTAAGWAGPSRAATSARRPGRRACCRRFRAGVGGAVTAGGRAGLRLSRRQKA